MNDVCVSPAHRRSSDNDAGHMHVRDENKQEPMMYFWIGVVCKEDVLCIFDIGSMVVNVVLEDNGGGG